MPYAYIHTYADTRTFIHACHTIHALTLTMTLTLTLTLVALLTRSEGPDRGEQKFLEQSLHPLNPVVAGHAEKK